MRTYLNTTLALLTALTLAGCSGGEGKKPEAKAPENAEKSAPAALGVKTASVVGRSVERQVEALGTLHPWDEITVSSEVYGTIEKISFDLGDRVKAGDTLAVLDQRETKLNLADSEAAHSTNIKTLEKAKARFIDAKTTLKRYDELIRDGMVSVSQYDTAKTQYDVAEAEMKEAEARIQQSAARVSIAKKRLSDTFIKAPISGEVKKRFNSAGEVVDNKTKLFTVVNTDTLKFRGTVAEASVPDIRKGQEVVIQVEAFKDRSFSGKVTRLSPSVDAETRTLEIEATVPNKSGVLKPGFFARGVILTKKDENIAFVPESAVYSFVGINKVFVIADGKANERIVKTGVREGGMVEVIGGLKPGDIVAQTNLPNLYDGVAVAVGEEQGGGVEKGVEQSKK